MDGVYLICYYYYYYLKITLISIDLINMTLLDGIDSVPIFVSIRQILHHGGFQMCKLNPTAGTTIAKMERDFTMIWIINSKRLWPNIFCCTDNTWLIWHQQYWYITMSLRANLNGEKGKKILPTGHVYVYMWYHRHAYVVIFLNESAW